METLSPTESKFFYAVLGKGSLVSAYDNGFVNSLIVSDKGKELLRNLIQYNNKFSKLPSQARFRDMYSEVMLRKHGDSLPEVINDLKNERIMQYASRGIKKIALALQEKKEGTKTPAEVSRLISTTQRRLVHDLDNIESPGVDIDFADQEYEEDYLRELHRRRKNDGMLGYEYPWPTANTVTKGIAKEQLIVYIARTGVGKTFLLTKTAVHLWRTHKVNTLIVSNEISNLGITDRFVSIATNIPYSNIRTGELSELEEQKIISFFGDIRQDGSKLIVTGNDGMSSGGLSSIESKCKKYGIKCLFVDGAYLLEDDLGASHKYERAANIARGLKKMAKRLHIPVVVSWQFNRDASKSSGGDTSAVGMTDVLSHDSDYIIAIARTEDEEANKITRMKTVKARESGNFELVIDWDFDTMSFDQHLSDENDYKNDDQEILDDTIEMFPETTEEVDF